MHHWLFFYSHLYPRHLNRCFTQQGWFLLNGVRWEDGAILHFTHVILILLFHSLLRLRSGWLKILLFSRDSEIYLSNLGVCVCFCLVNRSSCTCMMKIKLKPELECNWKNHKQKYALLNGWSERLIIYSNRCQKWSQKTKKAMFSLEKKRVVRRCVDKELCAFTCLNFSIIAALIPSVHQVHFNASVH